MPLDHVLLVAAVAPTCSPISPYLISAPAFPRQCFPLAQPCSLIFQDRGTTLPCRVFVRILTRQKCPNIAPDELKFDEISSLIDIIISFNPVHIQSIQ